ncbi:MULTISPECIES: hypothetical protein [Rheinheimera]|jgi:hypothetical protein|uniref:hypothetical protein n=1 Tax=Rheinheimera TaxID=67575 RepID=UPI001BFDD18B|nr:MULTISPECIES: hypothetical protein [Rheinheimera]MCS4308573.1 ABC-type transport system involved in cytochrome bd biosynthesis fused ATPase/permease subunit [Rheinheimera pacifica]
MSSLTTKWLAIATWLMSWLVIFWINFAAELSLMMHFVAIPVLLISTALGAGRYLEYSDHNSDD